MSDVKILLGNLVLIKYLVKKKSYTHPNLQKSLDAIHEILGKSDRFPNDYMNALNKYVDECINKVEFIRDNEEETPDGKEQINCLIEKLHQIINIQGSNN